MAVLVRETFIAGSEHVLRGRLVDAAPDGTSVPIDLTGGTVAVKAKLNGGATSTWNATIEDQVALPGKFFYQLSPGDVSAAGKLELQAWHATGGRTVKSRIVERSVEKSL